MKGHSSIHWRTEANCLKCDKIGLCSTVGRCLAESTGAARITSVAKAVDYMIEHLPEPIQLSDVARAGTLSPFHFHRVFRDVTTTTPARFLTSLRMAEARRLLLVTPKTVTDVCTSIGYSSLGTFISQFGKLTGLSPRRFRCVVEQIGNIPVEALVEAGPEPAAASGPIGAVTGQNGERCHALLGLFRLNRPQELPSMFTVIATNRLVALPPVPDGDYEPISVAVGPGATVRDVLATPIGVLGRVGFGLSPVNVLGGRCRHPFQVALRRQRRFDPPIEFTRPLLSLARRRVLRISHSTPAIG
ncbi:DNA-binding protein [Lentzea guizhouensis]|uniref:DNA-binding protein n=2 Tax=Lentzea guizhouensis TaxID=1586287 RepID=A0A1B2HPX3_9PSEU|nr:DNA-binding protein [Lentzea guizhouensis]